MATHRTMLANLSHQATINFTYTYTNNGDATNPYSPYGFDTNTFYTEKAANGEWNSVSGHKYTIMDPNYMGPFRSDKNDILTVEKMTASPCT